MKRKTNLLLLAAEQDSLSTHALFLALRESANYLSLAGLRTDARQPEEELDLPAAAVIALYDAFETLAEQLMGRASSLMVSWQEGALVLAAAAGMPNLRNLPVTARIREVEGILYVELPAEGKGGEGR